MRILTLVFWSRWLQALSGFLVIYGLTMVFIPEVMNRTLVGSLLYSNEETLLAEFIAAAGQKSSFLNVLSGLLGTVSIGWAIQMAWIAGIPFRNSERWAWNGLATSVGVWAVLEFYFKLTDGITGIGLFAHFGLLLAFAIPLLATYRAFHGSAMIGAE